MRALPEVQTQNSPVPGAGLFGARLCYAVGASGHEAHVSFALYYRRRVILYDSTCKKLFPGLPAQPVRPGFTPSPPHARPGPVSQGLDALASDVRALTTVVAYLVSGSYLLVFWLFRA